MTEMGSAFQGESLRSLAYLLATVAFVLGIKWQGRPETARRGNLLSSLGMLLALGATLIGAGLQLGWILLGLLLGGGLGAWLALRVEMTRMPEMVALFNGSGGLASLLVASAEFLREARPTPVLTALAMLGVLIGGLTFSGSLVAWGKLSERLPSRALALPGQQLFNLLLLALVGLALLLGLVLKPGGGLLLVFGSVVLLALLLGLGLVLPIGGGDMPVVIALLNAFSGLAAALVGFVLGQQVLVVSGCLVGASGLILTWIMCRAMNRSLLKVLFGQLGAAAGTQADDGRRAQPISPDAAFYLLEAAQSVVFVPGYGMAVAQAQHVVQELASLLAERGAEVAYAVHPVAGRMPGHMNVLLAEANVPYEQLLELEEINTWLPRVDLCLVIGANDIVNPDARSNAHSPLYGMPMIDADKARTVIVLKRSLGQGFAGVDNPLFVAENTRMLLGDARQSLQALIRELKAV